jgi:hypothetical protein
LLGVEWVEGRVNGVEVKEVERGVQGPLEEKRVRVWVGSGLW